MMVVLKTLRDFLTEEILRWMPGNLRSCNIVMLREHRKIEGHPIETVIHIFDAQGTYLGSIDHPAIDPFK